MKKWIVVAVLLSALSLGFSIYALVRTLWLEQLLGDLGAQVTSTEVSLHQYIYGAGGSPEGR